MSGWEKFKGKDKAGFEHLHNKKIFRRTFADKDYLEFRDRVQYTPIEDYDEASPEDLEAKFDEPLTIFLKFTKIKNYQTVVILAFRLMGYTKSEVQEILKNKRDI